MSYFWYNGTAINPDQISFETWKRAAYFGDGLFESVRIRNGKVLFTEAHINRIYKGVETLLFDVSKTKLTSQFEAAMTAVLSATSWKQARVRFNLFRSGEGYYTVQHPSFHYLCEATELETDTYTGFLTKTAALLTTAAKPVHSFSGIKSTQAQLFAYAGLMAQKLQVDEMIICNTAGHVCELTSANIFMYKNGTWITPPLSEGCMDGIMRRQLLRFFQAAGISFRETIILPEELTHAEMIIGSNCIQGINTYILNPAEKYNHTIFPLDNFLDFLAEEYK